MSDRERAQQIVDRIQSVDDLVPMLAIALAEARAEGLRQAAALLADCAQWDPECPHAARVRALAEGAKEGRQAATLSPPVHHRNGKRAGVKFAVEWLHNRANEMVDPNAKAILNTAAFQLGNAAKRGARLRALAEGGE